jgi:serine/threonine protein kinase
MPTSCVSKETGRSYIGKYRLQAHIATGGMGIIYKARHEETGEPVALKILLPALAQKPTTLERFRREAGRYAKLRHEHIVRLHEYGEANGIHFLALDYVPGIDLHEYISRLGLLEEDEACWLITQAVRALAYLHDQQIIHRDIKPSNFLVSHKDGWPILKLTDLGLARDLGGDEFRLTRSGYMVGTIDYIAPEQARDSGSADPRSDIYSLGCTFYHMLAGRPPFSEGSLPERLLRHVDAAPPDVRQFHPGLSGELVCVLERMLAKKPEERYQTPLEILADLNRLARGQPPKLNHPQLRIENGESRNEEEEAKIEDRGSLSEEQGSPRSSLSEFRSSCQKVALGQFTRANQAVAGHNYDYAIHLLLSCCKLDAANLVYRQFLRRLERFLSQNHLRSTRLAWWTTLPAKILLESAWKAKNYLRVLEYGERVLVRNPWDIRVQMTMAEAAEALDLPNLALWLLEQAWQKEVHPLPLSRALAGMYEKRGHLPQAIALWKLVLRENPQDGEAQWQIQNLGARETLLRGQYEAIIAKRSVEVG